MGSVRTMQHTHTHIQRVNESNNKNTIFGVKRKIIKQDASLLCFFPKGGEKPELRGSIAICTKVNEWAARLYSRRLKERLLFLFCVYLGGDFSTARVAGNRLRATPIQQEVSEPRLDYKNNLQGFGLYLNSVTSIS